MSNKRPISPRALQGSALNYKSVIFSSPLEDSLFGLHVRAELLVDIGVVVLGHGLVRVLVVVVEVADPLLDRTVEAEHALLEHQHPLAHLADRAAGVAHVEQRASLVADLLHPGHALLLERSVTHSEDLINEEDVRVGVHGDREAEPGEHSRGVVAHRGVEELPDVGELHDLLELALGLGLGHAQDGRVQVHVVPTGELRVEARTGRDQPRDAPSRQNLARVGAHHSVDHLQQGALAGPVESHEADRLAMLDRERHVIDGQERVADLLASDRRDRDLLDRAVIPHRELLTGMPGDDGLAHHRRSAIFVSSRVKASWASTSTTSTAPSMMKPRANRWSGIDSGGSAWDPTVGTHRQRCMSSTATVSGFAK